LRAGRRSVCALRMNAWVLTARRSTAQPDLGRFPRKFSSRSHGCPALAQRSDSRRNNARTANQSRPVQGI
jgi:hypothetical protein